MSRPAKPMATAALLRQAADALDEGTDPLSPYYLSRHDISADQCFTLAQQLAVGARICAKAIESPRSVEGAAWALAIARGA